MTSRREKVGNIVASRRELFEKLRIIKLYPDLDQITEKAYKDLEDQVWRDNLNSSPHGRPWFTSFHASAFPNRDKPCGRLALYTMLDIPNAAPAPPFLVAAGGIGKAVEQQIVYRWAKAGLTLGMEVPESEDTPFEQVKFADEKTWLTGSADAILDLRPHLNSVVPVDIKSKKQDVVEDMRAGRKSYEEKHFNQVQAYLYLCNIFHEEMGWSEMGLEPAKSAYIFYASRQDPRTTAEFYIPIDWDFINSGLEQLALWRDSYLNDELPERPKEWRWTEEPCKWCPMKKYVCKPDNKAKVTKLSESNAIEFAKELRPSYDFEETKKEVLKRW
jgi:hypothetical protein